MICHIVDRFPKGQYLSSETLCKILRFLRTDAVGIQKHLPRSLPSAFCTAQRLYKALRLLQSSPSIATLQLVQCSIESVLILHPCRQQLCTCAIRGHHRKGGVFRSRNQFLGLCYSFLQAAFPISGIMLHTSAGIQHQNHIPAIPSLTLKIRRHKSQYQ